MKELPNGYQETLSQTIARSLEIEVFENYVHSKFDRFEEVIACFRKPIFRSLAFTSYCLGKSSIDKMLHRFKKWLEEIKTKSVPESEINNWMNDRKENDEVLNHIVNNINNKSDKVYLIYGNGGKNGNNLRGTPNGKNIGLERRFRSLKEVILIEGDEKDTSKTCPCCREKMLQKQSFPNRMFTEERHQLLRCQNVDCSCRWWSRDILGALNIKYKAINKVIARE